MATTFVDVLLQVRDELGADALAGGKIHTYEAGTTTPLATYQNLAGSVANTNPVVLDSAGMAVIRQTDGVAYKWVVTDADDNELWSRDNITVGSANSAAGQAILVPVTFVGQPAAQQFMGGALFDDDAMFPIDFEGSIGSIEVSPASDFEISIRKNGTEIGTATINTGGAYTFATTGGSTVSVTTGDKLTFIAPDSIPGGSDFTLLLAGSVA
ncbi:hypothetical protein [Tsuneonella sp. HG222]